MEWIINRGKADAGFSSEIIVSDEARFHLDGFVDGRNCRVRGSERPRVIGERQTHPQRVAVRRGFWAAGIVGPYSFGNEAGRAATVHGARYRGATTRFFPPKLDDVDVADAPFQRDDAARRAADETIRLPHETFPARVLSRFGDRNWPPWIVPFNAIPFLLTGLFEAKRPRRRAHDRACIARRD